MTRDLLLFACGLSFAACWDWDHLVGGADASDAAPTSFCAQVDARFCDDFDDSDGATFDHWSSSNFSHAATMSRAPSDASTPFAARFDSYGVDGGIPEAFLKTYFTDVVTSFVTFSFDMRVDQFPTIPTASFTAAGFALASDNGGAILLIERDGATLAATIPTDGGTSYTTLPLAFVAQPGVHDLRRCCGRPKASARRHGARPAHFDGPSIDLDRRGLHREQHGPHVVPRRRRRGSIRMIARHFMNDWP
jgi:hypothetical protein